MNGTGTSSSWTGIMVTSGTVSVKVSLGVGGNSQTPTANVTVNLRTGWAFNSVSPQKVANGSGTGLCTGLLPVLPTPTSNSSDFGQFCYQGGWTYHFSQVSGGPNNGYYYTTSVSNVDGANGNPTAFQWERVPDLDNASSTFYMEQTGTYNVSNPSTGPNGCVSGSNLATQTQRHEAGSVQGHWGNYNNSQNQSSNNLGVLAEAQVGLPTLTSNQYQAQVDNALQSANSTILTATQVQPYPVNDDQNGTFLGFVNFPPAYTSCK